MSAEPAFAPVEYAQRHDAHKALLNGNLEVLNDLIDGIGKLSEQAYTSLPGDQKSSIGMHVRHVIEFYQEFLKSILREEISGVCYDNRKRNLDFEISKRKACLELKDIVTAIESSDLRDRDLELSVIIDPDQPLSKLRTSLHRELYHVLDHAVHHMAIIKILAFDHNVIFDESFGLANATQKERQKNIGS